MRARPPDHISRARPRPRSIVLVSLCLFYYWVVWAPLTRGTAAVGYALLLGLLRRAGLQPGRAVPVGVQLDWEAILCASPAEFCAVAGQWLLVDGGVRPVETSVGESAGLDAWSVADALRALSA